MEQVKIFVKGWRRKSRLLLDLAGCPTWLARWRCRLTPTERVAWVAISDLVRRGEMYRDEDE